MNERLLKILEVITEQKRIEVSALAAMFGLSQVTMRKELDVLEGRGLIMRERGFALVNTGDDLSFRLAYHYDVKQKIARLAASDVSDGETVMIESGSCCALLAYTLTESGRGVKIITNSAFIAAYIRKLPYAKVFLLGGDYQNESQVMVGSAIRHYVKEFFVDKLFVGTDGFSPGIGFTGNDRSRAEAVRDMAAQAKRVHILTESEKFSQHGVVPLLAADMPACVYTDGGIPGGTRDFLEGRGVTIKTIYSQFA